MTGSVQNNSPATVNRAMLGNQADDASAASETDSASPLTGLDGAPSAASSLLTTPEPAMRSATSSPMTWSKAGQAVAKHAAFGVAGFMPFAAAVGANTMANLYQFGSEFIQNHGQEGYSAVSTLLDALGSSAKVGGAIAAAGVLLAYPLGRFVMAPVAEKSYDVLMPTELKEVVSFAAEEVPVAAQKGASAVTSLAANTLDAIKQAPETAPAALAKAGVMLGGLTQRGADAVTRVTQNNMGGDARYDRAAANESNLGAAPVNTTRTSTRRATMDRTAARVSYGLRD